MLHSPFYISNKIILEVYETYGYLKYTGESPPVELAAILTGCTQQGSWALLLGQVHVRTAKSLAVASKVVATSILYCLDRSFTIIFDEACCTVRTGTWAWLVIGDEDLGDVDQISL